MPRNLVICCDGTNNSLDSPLTNVAHLGALADIGDAARQLAYYDAGVGVEAHPNMRTRIGAMFSKWSGSAFGTGLVENVQNAYSHLVDNYSDGDHVYLFGFSRGAYTARAVAGVLGSVGIADEIRNSERHWNRYRDLAKLRSQQRDLNLKSRRQKKRNDALQAQIDALLTDPNRPNAHENIKIKCIGVFDTAIESIFQEE